MCESNFSRNQTAVINAHCINYCHYNITTAHI